MAKQPSKRTLILGRMRVAGCENDRKAWTRLYAENRISLAMAEEAFINRSMTILDESKVREIRAMYIAGKGPTEIAKHLGLPVGPVGDAARRRSWRHIKP